MNLHHRYYEIQKQIIQNNINANISTATHFTTVSAVLNSLKFKFKHAHIHIFETILQI